jgi:hypothetical protein
MGDNCPAAAFTGIFGNDWLAVSHGFNPAAEMKGASGSRETRINRHCLSFGGTAFFEPGRTMYIPRPTRKYAGNSRLLYLVFILL